MDDRRKLLEQFSKKISDGVDSSAEFIDDPILGKQAYAARNLAEDSLANEVLKNTGVPVPNKGAGISKQEDFLNRIIQERYPEISPDVRMADLRKHGADGLYVPSKGIIGVDSKFKDNPLKALSTSLHEAGHQYDDKVLNYDMPYSLKSSSNQMDTKAMYKKASKAGKELDPTELFETMAKGHHARIPNLRDADSYGLGALKSMLKSRTFRGVAPVLAKGALATAGGLASLASEASDSEDAGGSLEQAAFLRERDEMVRRGDNLKQANPLQKQALQGMYDNIDSNPRMDALKKISGK